MPFEFRYSLVEEKMVIESNEIKRIFLAAVDLTDSQQRNELLDIECGSDVELRRRVEMLLRAHDDPASVVANPIGGSLTRVLPDTHAQVGQKLAGKYKLLEPIGEGGMGTVWVAEQFAPVKRKVAIKLIKPGMDSKSVLARFEAERQALAVMDHANIAKVLDGGMTDQGRPYFVMEYVKGIPITEYCDSRQLSVPERLQLFAQVCQAVQHAHQKGIIHRDLKPSNVLVAPYDDKPVPKVIDFGLAKAMHQSLTENTLHTAHDMVLGTPLYMSPEQAQLNNIDIDTRSDVYSLGVLLYELLTGSTPLEKQRFKQAAWDEMRRMIREEDPPVPSQRLSSAETLPLVAAGRHMEPTRLTRMVRGELDWIVMKALEKDRTRRYETANGFAADVLRYLSGEPVMAAPPSAMYRFQKFVRRNKGKVVAAGLVLLALLAGMAGTSWQWYRAKQSLAAEAVQRNNAEDNERAAEVARAEAVTQQTRAQEQEAEAKKQAAIAEAVAKFQTDMLAAADPEKLLGDKVTVLQAMTAAVKALDEGSLKDQPLVEAGVRITIGNTLLGLGLYDQAEPNLRKSLEIRRAVRSAGHPEIASSLAKLAELLLAQNKLAEVEPLVRESLEIFRAALPAGHPNIADGLNNLATLLLGQNKLAEAEPLYREALEIYGAFHPAGHPEIAKSLNNLAVLLYDQNKLAEAEPLYREALKIYGTSVPAGHPEIATTLNNLAELLLAQNKLVEAEPVQREALEVRRASLPAGHPNIAASLNSLAGLLRAQNKLAEAESLMREAIEIYSASLPAGHPEIGRNLANLAGLYWQQGKLDQSIPMYEEALNVYDAAHGRRHPQTLEVVGNLGVNYKDAGRLAEAIPLLEEAYRASQMHAELRWVSAPLSDAYAKSGETKKVNDLIREHLAEARKSLPTESPQLALQLATMSTTLLTLKAWDEAEPLLREALTIREKAEPDDWRTFNTHSMLGGALLGQKKYAEAEPRLLAGYEGLQQREAAIPPESKIRIPEALERLVLLYTELHAAQPDQGHDTKAAEWQTKLKEHNAGKTTATPTGSEKPVSGK